jgi:predicted nucleotidyltransferase
MNHDELVSSIRSLAIRINADIGSTNWYLFGSAKEGLWIASDIDLVVVCHTDSMADAVRRAVDIDQFARPIHLSILTHAEEAEIGFVEKQGCIRVV